jgi:hypothetical protein
LVSSTRCLRPRPDQDHVDDMGRELHRNTAAHVELQKDMLRVRLETDIWMFQNRELRVSMSAELLHGYVAATNRLCHDHPAKG